MCFYLVDCGRVYEGLSRLLIDRAGTSGLWVAPFAGQMVLDHI